MMQSDRFALLQLLVMDEYDEMSTEALTALLQELEEKYIRNLTSKFNKDDLNKTWSEIQLIKKEIRQRNASSS